jgi:ribosomal protein S18 acetylase RimI-like enzyme
MVIIRDMLPQEYAAYCEYFIKDYSQEIVENYGHSIETAIQLAEKDLYEAFPNGLENSPHKLMCIEVDNDKEVTHVGYLWHSINESDTSTFIYDFYISENYRGKGYGKKAIDVLGLQMQDQEIANIKLRVAFQNKRALKLYLDSGFVITGYNMLKEIGTA